MAYLTDRKRAAGLGSAKTGTAHHWQMIVTSVMLVGLVPQFVFTFGMAVGLDHEAVLAFYARPYPAIVAALTILCGFVHFKNGCQTMIEDYVQGTARKVAIIAVTCLSYAAAAVGLFAIVRIAL